MKRIFAALALLLFFALPSHATDRSTVLLMSATCTTSYQGGTAIESADSARLSLFLSVTKAGSGSSMTSATFKLQVTYDGTNWHDVGSTRNDASLTTAIEHAITAPSAGSTSQVLLQTTSHSPALYWRVAAKVAGGACVAGDILLAKGWVQR